MAWLETYRGTVYRWEVDNVDHFTVAYYFARFEDATHALLHAVGLDAEALAGTGLACVPLDCHVRYLRELRVGDILHIRSWVLGAEERGLRLAHEVVDSGDGALCTTVEQTVVLVDEVTRARRPLDVARRDAALARAVDWTMPPDPPRGGGPSRVDATQVDGLLDTCRDAIKPWEVDGRGEAALPAYIHRFSAANSHVLAGFGVTPAYMREQRRGFSTFEFYLRVPGAVRAGDLVRVRSGLLHVGSSSVRILHRLVNARTDEDVASLEQAGVLLDLDARRPTPLPGPLRERALGMLVAAPPARGGELVR